MELGNTIALTDNRAKPRSGQPSPPVATGVLGDIVLQQGVEMSPVDLSLDFAGTGLVFSIAPTSDQLPAGLFLSVGGVLTGAPAVSTSVPLGIVVMATNILGSAESAFVLTVEAMVLNFTANLSGLTDNATYGPSAEDGREVSAVASGFNAAPPSVVTYQWSTIEGGPIFGATGPTLIPDASINDGDSLYCTISAEPYPDRDTAAAVVRHSPPAVLGTFADEILDLGSGDYVINAAAVFSGKALSFSVSGPGCIIDEATGLLTIATFSVVSGAAVVVTAANSGGQASAGFQLTIEDMDVGPGPELSVPLVDEAADSISFTVSEDCTIYWRRDPTGTNPDAAQIIAGGGFDHGSFPVTAGSNVVDIMFAQGNDGIQALSLVAAVIPSEPSLVRTVTIDIDATPPQLLSSAPPSGGTNVSPDTTIELFFDEPVIAGQGSFTLWDVAAGSASQVFDAANVGPAPGQIEIDGSTLRLHPPEILQTGRQFAVLIEEGAVRDTSGNPFAGFQDTTTLGFAVAQTSVVDTGFDAAFTVDYPGLWNSMQAHAFNATVVHRPAEAWTAYPTSTTAGGIVGDKTGPYAQVRFMVPVEVGKSYEIDADLPIGESHDGAGFAGVLRIKLGSAVNLSDYFLNDFSSAGQPRIEMLRGVAFQALTSELWFAIISETSVSGVSGGDPAVSMLRVREV